METNASTQGLLLRRALLLLIITIAGIGSLGFLQQRVDSLKQSGATGELLYFPNDKLLRYSTAGLNNVVADIMWYRTVQYTAREFKSQSHKFEWLEHMIRVVTTLDPHHVDAYRYGGMFLALTGAEDLGIPILQEGFRNNPASWEIPYELHTIYLMRNDNSQESRMLASHYALMVAERHSQEFKRRYFELAQNILSGSDMHDEAIEILTMAVEQAKNPLVREQAANQLLKAYISKNLSTLRQASETYTSAYDKKLTSLNDLVAAKLVSALPENADEGRYFIDASGNIQNTVIVRDRETRTRNRIERHVRNFYDNNGRYPNDIGELELHFMKDKKYVYPLPDKEWFYDPVTNKLTVR